MAFEYYYDPEKRINKIRAISMRKGDGIYGLRHHISDQGFFYQSSRLYGMFIDTAQENSFDLFTTATFTLAPVCIV